MDPEQESPLIYRAFDVESIKAIDTKARSISFVCSTDCIDRYGDIVEQSWRLASYQKNPIVLFAHQSRELPIGRAEDMRVVRIEGRDQLECTVVFASEKANPVAEQVYQLCVEKILKTVSVGFMPKSVRYEMRDGKEVCVLADNELCELSVTPVPANPEALAKHLARARRNSAPPPAQKDTDMDPKELELLKAKAAESDALKAKAVEREAARVSELAAKDALLAERDADLATKDAELAEKDAQLVVLGVAGDRVVELEIDALVGKKILPVERDAFIELKKESPAIFEKLMAVRPSLGLTGKQLAADPSPIENSVAADGADDTGKGLDSLAKASAEAKR